MDQVLGQKILRNNGWVVVRFDPIGPFTFSLARLPLVLPYRWAKGEQTLRESIIVRYKTPIGEGFGEIAPPPGDAIEPTLLVQEASRLLDGFVPGVDLLAHLADLKHVGFASRVRCGLVSAWLCAEAVARKESLALYLGRLVGRAPASMIPVNALIVPSEIRAPIDQVFRAKEQGITTVKIKLLGDVVADFEMVSAIRKEFPETSIRLDPNGSWNFEQAPQELERYSSLSISYVEDPLPEGSTLTQLSALSEASPIPVAADALCASERDAYAIIAKRAASVLVLKPQRLGGPDVVLRVADVAHEAGFPVTLTGSLESAVGTWVGLQTAAVLPTPLAPCGLGTATLFQRDIGKVPLPEGGNIALSCEPGLGMGLPDEFWQR